MIRLIFISTGLMLANIAAVAEPESPPVEELIEKATRGDTDAQISLAIHYRDGKGVAKDNAEAMRWAHLAADTPGLQIITAADMNNFWRSDHRGELSKGVLSRPAFVVDVPRQ